MVDDETIFAVTPETIIASGKHWPHSEQKLFFPLRRGEPQWGQLEGMIKFDSCARGRADP